jgi:hypothetical protein
MKRKTNLFYTSGPDSKFLTFSNYTEALTGNFLSTNSKLFPDKFICLKIDNLNSINKPTFIKYLVAYYENKLAILRDNLILTNNNVEKNIYPLAYLLEAILSVVTIVKNGNTYSYILNCDSIELDQNEPVNTEDDQNSNVFIDIVNNVKNILHIENIKNKLESSLSFEDLITYIGDVTEYDYNGIYADTICNINMSSFVTGTIEAEKKLSITNQTYSTDDLSLLQFLYGWDTELPILSDDNETNIYKNVNPIFDDLSKTSTADDENNVTNKTTGIYNYSTYLTRIVYNITENTSVDYGKTLKFNVLIPLFSYINIDVESNTNVLEPNIDNDTGKRYINVKNINANDNKAIMDVPLGIWLYADKETETFITLEKDIELNLYPTWSLLISSQFKPFPYSGKLNKDVSTKESTLNAFSTFSQVLSKMNNILDEFSKISNNMQTLTNRIELIEKRLGSSNTQTLINRIENIEDVLGIKSKSEVDKIKEDNDELEQFKQQIYSYIRNLIWTAK